MADVEDKDKRWSFMDEIVIRQRSRPSMSVPPGIGRIEALEAESPRSSATSRVDAGVTGECAESESGSATWTHSAFGTKPNPVLAPTWVGVGYSMSLLAERTGGFSEELGSPCPNGILYCGVAGQTRYGKDLAMLKASRAITRRS